MSRGTCRRGSGVRAPVALTDCHLRILDGYDGRRDEGARTRAGGHGRRQGTGAPAGEQGERGQHRVEELRGTSRMTLQLLDALHADAASRRRHARGTTAPGARACRTPPGARRALAASLAARPMRCASVWHARRAAMARRRRRPAGRRFGVGRSGHQPLHERSDEQEQRDVTKRPIHWNTTSAAMNLAAAGTREQLLSNMAALGPFPSVPGGAATAGALRRTAVGLRTTRLFQMRCAATRRRGHAPPARSPVF